VVPAAVGHSGRAGRVVHRPSSGRSRNSAQEGTRSSRLSSGVRTRLWPEGHPSATRGRAQCTPEEADRGVAHLGLTDDARRQVEGWRDRRATRVTDALHDLDAEERDALRAAVPVLVALAGIRSRTCSGATDSASAFHRCPHAPDIFAYFCAYRVDPR
jgi:hypothetical protein